MTDNTWTTFLDRVGRAKELDLLNFILSRLDDDEQALVVDEIATRLNNKHYDWQCGRDGV